ncbi:MAG TPA: DnaJ C-terminal domain-containing protein, partial [Luteitalea sp.]|nr:DnaJ C-terminal domain-containing protein [Luteitalea sp.]
GHVGQRGGPPGDLRLRIRVAPDARWSRQGQDLHLVLPVAVHEAVLGARLVVPTPDGDITVKVPQGTQSGQRLRLRERGVPSRRTGQRGDLVLDVQLVLPPVIDARGRVLMQEFARLHPEDVRARWGMQPSPSSADAEAHAAGPGHAHDRPMTIPVLERDAPRPKAE